MCWEVDYRFLVEQKKAQDTRIKQQQRADLIDQLLKETNQPRKETEVEETPAKEVVPAK
jgi:hypothetical protein